MSSCCRREGRDGPDASWQRHSVLVGNDTDLSAYRFMSNADLSSREVVVISVGFGNSCSLLGLLGNRSLAHYLDSESFDAWTFDFRGHGRSTTKSTGWDMSTYAFEDAVGVISYILGMTRKTCVHWIGHSMGGMIGLALASCEETSHYLCSVTAMASSIYLQHSIYWYPLYLTPTVPFIYCLGGIDLGCLTLAGSVSLSSTPCLPSCGLIDRVASSSNAGLARTHLLLRRDFCYEPYGVVCDLKKGFKPAGICLSYPRSTNATTTTTRGQGQEDLESSLIVLAADEGAATVNIRSSIGLYCSNICLVYGTDDPQITPKDVLRLSDDIRRNFSTAENDSATLECIACGKSEGQRAYSHFDVIIGEDAPSDVFPRLGNFLRSQRRADEGADADVTR